MAYQMNSSFQFSIGGFQFAQAGHPEFISGSFETDTETSSV